MDKQEMLDRTLALAVRVAKLVESLPRGPAGRHFGQQVLRSGSSVGANYREALRASSRKQFITTLEIAEREAAETEYWMDLLIACELVKARRLAALRNECCQIVAMLTASGRTAKRKLKAAAQSRSRVVIANKSEIRNSKSQIPTP